MGRKIKPRHLKRDHVSISLPLDVIIFLDEYVARTGGTRSRYLESLVREAMLKGQTTLDQVRHVWWCPQCDVNFHTARDAGGVMKHSCGTYLEEKTHYRGTLEEWKKKEEEE